MGSIVICGGGVIGLSAAMLLARDDHDVTLLERDADPPPATPFDAWERWGRVGVAQFHQPHNLFPRFRQILDDELPGMVDRLVDAGCVWIDPLAMLPPSIVDRGPRPDDDKFRFVTGRRPVVELVLARAAEEDERIRVRRGVAVSGLIAEDGLLDGVPRITGVRTSEGEELTADLVVDATGRRTKLSEWLEAVGAGQPHVQSEDCRFVYHTRYFTGPELPATIGPPIAEMGTISLLTLPGDNGTWSVTVWGASADVALKKLRDADRFTAVVRACPLQAHWADGDPITDVLAMAGILDRYRRFVIDGRPVATGVAAVGDAWACTNPSAGRGMTVGLIHAQRLRDVVRSYLDQPVELARAWDDVTEAEVAPFYWNQIAADRARIAEMDALREGLEPPPPDPMRAAIRAAAGHDPDVFRAALEAFMCLALPQEAFARPDVVEKVRAATPPPTGERTQAPGPDRAALLDLLA